MLTRRRQHWSLSAVGTIVFTAMALRPVLVTAQDPGGSIRGRVTDARAAPLAQVRIVAQSASLTSHRETMTSRHGDFQFAFMPAGDYVVTYAGDGLVTVKRTTRLSALETVFADAVMVSAERAHEAIVVVIDRETFPRAPVFSTNYQDSTLDQLPLDGGVSSALTLSPGAFGGRIGEALFTLDGAPVRLDRPASRRRLLDPGAAALQEVTFVTAGASADAGHFQSGVMAVVTRSGGDRLSGAFGVAVTNGGSEADVVEGARSSDGLAISPYYQLGGPLLNGSRTRLFASGRHLTERTTHQARLSDAAFSSPARERFWEVKATHALTPSHRLQGVFVFDGLETRQAPPADAVSVEDARALEDRASAHRLATFSYTGVLGPALQVTARVTGERFTSAAEGAERTDLVSRTAVRDRQIGSQVWAPGSCAECDPDRRTSTTGRISAGYLLSTRSDTHQITAGYERSSGRIDPGGVHPDGDFEVTASRWLVRGDGIFPVLEPNGSADIVWRPSIDNRLAHGTDALFLGDEWRRGSDVTIQAGLRWDRQHLSTVGTAQRILTERGISPRLDVSWRPSRSPDWVVTAGYARQAGDLLRATGAADAGPAERRFAYLGPPINASSDASLVDTDVVVADALNWLFANGGTGRAPSFATEAGFATTRPGVGDLPHESVLMTGVSRSMPGTSRFRADLIWSRLGGLRTDLLSRHSTALNLQIDYPLGVLARFTASYSLSRAWGNADVWSGQNGQLEDLFLDHPEFVDAAWAAPMGHLSDDRRHRLKLWGHVDLPVSESLGYVGLDLLQTVESGRPYGLWSWIDASPFVADSGSEPPVSVPYYFTARDAFRTPSARRTDLSVRYSRGMTGSIRSELIVRLHVLNLFAARRVLDPQAFAVATTAFTDPGRFAAFDPFSQSPELGVHWDTDARLSDALDTATMTMPRAYRLSVALRF